MDVTRPTPHLLRARQANPFDDKRPGLDPGQARSLASFLAGRGAAYAIFPDPDPVPGASPTSAVHFDATRRGLVREWEAQNGL